MMDDWKLSPKMPHNQFAQETKTTIRKLMLKGHKDTLPLQCIRMFFLEVGSE
jgi:hypothetical protein